MRVARRGRLLLWIVYTFALLYILVFMPPLSVKRLEEATNFGDPGGRIRHMLLFTVEGYLSSSLFDKVGLYFSITLGGLTEGAQRFVPWRSCDPLDFIADLLGSLLGFLFYFLQTHSRAGEVGVFSWLHPKVDGVGKEDN